LVLKKSFRASATVEFLIFGLPLFAIILSLNLKVFLKSTEITDSLNLARQLVRVFVTSESDEIGYQRVEQAYKVGFLEMRNGTQSSNQNPKVRFEVECQRIPCLTSNSWVRVKIINENGEVVTSAISYVDMWRNQN
jgi:hypothetical protein